MQCSAAPGTFYFRVECDMRRQVRAALQDLVRKAVAKLKAQVPDGKPDAIVAFLSQALVQPESSVGARSINLWFNSASAQDVHRWVMANNSAAVTGHASYVAASACALKRLHLDKNDDSALDFSLADFCFTVADAIYESVPTSVPALASAVCVKIQTATGEHGADKDLRDDLPDWCHFLCEESAVESQEVSRLCLQRGLPHRCTHERESQSRFA